MNVSHKIGQFYAGQETDRLAKMFIAAWRYTAMAKKDGDDPVRLATQARALPPIIDALKAMQGGRVTQVIKAATAAGTTTGWGVDLAAYEILQDAFLASLRNISIFESALPFMMNGPLHVSYPIVTTGPTATTVGEGQVKPVSKMTITRMDLTEKKTSVIVPLSDELVRHATNGLSYFQREMIPSVTVAIDNSFLSEITSGISTSPSNGGTSIAVLQDIDNAVRSITRRSSSKIFLAVSPDIAAAWAFKLTTTGALTFPDMMTPNGGTVQGCQVVATDAVSQQIIAFDAGQIGVADFGIDLDQSNEASIQLDTSPDSPPGATSPYISAWQLNLTLARATRYWGVKRSNNTCVSVITNVSYSGDSPS
jgi:HK97 family phage major capsid protein